MFTILLSEKMDLFYKTILAFPTVVFSAFLVLCLFYWLFAVLGLVDLDFLDFDIPNVDGASNLDAEGLNNLNVMSGLLLKFGLNGVPFTIAFSFLVFIAWIISFLLTYYLYSFIPDGWIEWLVGLPLLIVVTLVSAIITGKVIKPLKPFFMAANQEIEKTLLGQTVIIRTARADPTFGEAKYEDGGAGLIVKVRTCDGEQFKRGDKVVLLEHLVEQNAYKIISEEEFYRS